MCLQFFNQTKSVVRYFKQYKHTTFKIIDQKNQSNKKNKIKKKITLSHKWLEFQ